MKKLYPLPESVNDAVALGLQRLFALRLEGAPSAENMAEVVPVWLDAIAFAQQWRDDDAERFHAAFLFLTRTCARWPQPVHLLNALPPRPMRKLPEPPRAEISAEEEAEFFATLNGLTGRMTQYAAPKFPQPPAKAGSVSVSYRNGYATFRGANGEEVVVKMGGAIKVPRGGAA